MNKEILSVLLVDDSPDDQEWCVRCLESDPVYSYKVDIASTAQEGLELWSKSNYDCVLLDFRLPGFTGLKLLKELQAIKRTDKVVIIMLTGQGDEDIAVEALMNGADDYITKRALNASRLTQSIRSAFDKVILKQIVEQQGEDLKRSNRELENFALIASHDLREPLRKVMAFSSKISEKCRDVLDESSQNHLGIIIDSVSRMQGLLDSLLKYSKVSNSEHESVAVDTKQMFEQILSDITVRINETQAEISLEGDFPTVEAEPHLIRNLFQNLILNAIKFQKPGNKPVLEILSEIDAEKSSVAISVIDNGIGFPESKAEDMFNQFTRLHGRSQYEGTGMGLAICKAIVEKHRGDISATSVEGVGSKFTVVLPLQQKSEIKRKFISKNNGVMVNT